MTLKTTVWEPLSYLGLLKGFSLLRDLIRTADYDNYMFTLSIPYLALLALRRCQKELPPSDTGHNIGMCLFFARKGLGMMGSEYFRLQDHSRCMSIHCCEKRDSRVE